MKKINLLFDLHIPISLREFRFFEIGKNNPYFTDYDLELSTIQIANNTIKPLLSLIENTFDLISTPSAISLSVTGSTLELLALYAPETIAKIKRLKQKGYINICNTTYVHSVLANNPQEFTNLILENNRVHQSLFETQSTTINLVNQAVGYDTLSELGQYQPSSVYISDEQAYTIKNSNESFIIADKNLSIRLQELLNNEGNGFNDITKVNDYIEELELNCANRNVTLIHFKPQLHQYSFGISQQVILQEVLEAIVNCNFLLGTEDSFPNKEKQYPFDIVFHKEEWHNIKPEFNEMQQEAIDLLCHISNEFAHYTNNQLNKDWLILQDEANIKYIKSEYLNEKYVAKNYSPYSGPYQAFMNLVNILSDFEKKISSIATITQKV